MFLGLASTLFVISIKLKVTSDSIVDKNDLICSECNYPLGMEDGRIKDDQITATAHHVDSSAAHFGRLNGVNGAGAWCHSSIDKDERDQYLQVSAHFLNSRPSISEHFIHCFPFVCSSIN